MTIANLVVSLSAETAQFHQDMQAVASRTNRVAREISRAGMEVSTAISLPLLAAGFGAFAAILDRSKQAFGPLFQAFDQLKASTHALFVELGSALTPLFQQMIAGATKTADSLRDLVAWFNKLPPGLKSVLEHILLFLAYLGPTILAIGKLAKIIAAFPALIAAFTTATGGWILAIAAVGAAAVFLATHWDEVTLRLELAWTAIKEAFFGGVDVVLGALAKLTSIIPGLGKYVQGLKDQFDAFADSSLAKNAVAIQELTARLEGDSAATAHHTALTAELQKISDDYTESLRRMKVLSEGVGSTFNLQSAEAEILKTAIDGANAAHVQLGQTIPGVNLTLQDAITLWQALSQEGSAFAAASQAFGSSLQDQERALRLYNALLQQGIPEPEAARQVQKWGSESRSAVEGLTDALGGSIAAAAQAQAAFNQFAQGEGLGAAIRQIQALTQQVNGVGDALRQGIAQALTALADDLGSVLSGIGRGFRDFGKQMEGILGAMLQTTGQVLIAYGLAGLAIHSFITNPFAALTVGAAMEVLGSALAGAAQATVSGGSGLGAGSGGGGGGAAATPSYSATQDTGPVIVQFPDGQHIYDASDPRQVEAFREFFANLIGRDVIVQVG